MESAMAYCRGYKLRNKSRNPPRTICDCVTRPLDQRAQNSPITRQSPVPVHSIRASNAQGHHAASDRCCDRSRRHCQFTNCTRQSANLAQYLRSRLVRKWHSTRARRTMVRFPAANLGASAASSLANWTGEEIRERDLAQAQESGREESNE